MTHAAGVIFRAPSGKVLLLKRSPTEANYASHWGLPGGKGEDGEEPWDTAARETKEETGYEATQPGLHIDSKRTPTGMTFHTFFSPVDDEFTPALDGEHTEHGWFSADDMPSPMHPGVADTLGVVTAQDMTREDWDAMRAGWRKFMHEEESEGEHNEQDLSDLATKLDKFFGEEQREPAHQVEDDLPPVYLQRQLWSGHDAAEPSALISGSMRDYLAKQATAERKPLNIKGAPGTDSKPAFCAYDKMPLSFDKSARSFTPDGFMNVAKAPISKANICEYYGYEIPDYEQLGLDRKTKYKLLRHPDELKKAAKTFNNLPVLDQHIPVTAEEFPEDSIIGSTGTDANFDGTYLTNSLVFWRKPAIEDIEAADDGQGGKKEISCAYRYRADMTPGTFRGEHHDGIMRDIVGNHAAQVSEGRAGSDVAVPD